MRRKMQALLVLVFVFTLTAQTAYFPKGALGPSADLDQFKAIWYGRNLHALQEPSLFALTKMPLSESYRFLWLRTFNHPVSIRIDCKPDGSSVVTAKITSGTAGYNPGVLSQTSSRTLTKEQTQSFLKQIDAVGFWQLPSEINDQSGTDGSQWVIEGVKQGKYHLVDRWTPKNGAVHDLGLIFTFELGQLHIPKSEVY
jgi:hypothetical protein